MKSKPDMITPSQVIDIALRWRWIILMPLFAALIVGIYLVITLPKVYRADTLILVQGQKVPDEFVRSVVTSDSDTRLNTISQQIMSRSNLEEIIEQFNLFSDSKYENMYMEDKIASLRKRISVDLIRADERKAADAFSISFKGENPRLVAKVANGLARYFMDENMKVRETQALGTSDFLEDELVTIRQQLEAQEENLKKYREAYMGGLPEQLDTNLRILEGLQIQLNMKNESLRYAKNNLILVEKHIEVLAPPDAAGENQEKSPLLPVYQTEDELKLKALENRLEQLRLSYTDKHPDIVKLQKNIEELQKKIATEAGEQTDAIPSGQPAAANKAVPSTLDFQQRLDEREELKNQIAALNAKIEDIERKVVFYQKMVQDTPKREQEFLSLNRDYQNIKSLYDSILARKLESDISVNMEKSRRASSSAFWMPPRFRASRANRT
jgi:polysaccharide chain length determinant protein (PEP-CTERM system associated)